MGERVKTGVVLFLLYTVLFAVSQLYQVVPGLSGCGSRPCCPYYGLIFGRLGAIAAALGAAAGMALTGGSSNFIPIEFLGALLSAYLPSGSGRGCAAPGTLSVRGRPADGHHVLCPECDRGRTHGGVPGSGRRPVPGGAFPGFLSPDFPGFPGVHRAGGFLVYSQAAPRMFRGAGEALWNRIRDNKGTTRSMAVAMLRIALTGGFLGLGLAFIFPNEFELIIVEYVMGIFAALLFILTAV